MDDESVEFVEELMTGREALLKESTKLLVRILGRGETVAFEKAAGVGVNNEDRMASGI